MKITVYVSDLTHTSQTVASNTIPFAIGSLVTYAKAKLRNPEMFNFRIFKYPERLISAILEQVPDIACFSNYAWNFDLSYQIVERIKEKNPKAIIIFGGPNYPTEENEQEKLLKEHPLIDFHVFKEGEVAFLELLQQLTEQHFDIDQAKKAVLRSCYYIFNDKLITGPIIERIKNLDDIPSPYLTGEMDEFFDSKLVPIIQTNRGCPFTCTFCVEGFSYYNKVNKRSADTIYKELCYIVQRKHPDIHDLHIADSNFGMYKEDEIIGQIIAKVQEQYGWPKYLHTSTGKNQKERVLRVAKTVNSALRLAGSVQSLSEKVLENIKRNNISADELMELASEARKLGSNTYSEIILALPGDTKETHLKSVETIVNAKFNWIRIYTLMMLSGTDMASAETRNKYKMETRYRVLPRCFGMYSFGDEKPIVSAEIEEVCVSTADLPFEDYINCRLFALTVEIFYNDSVAAELLEFLNLFNISVFDWLNYIHQHQDEFSENLKKIYDIFFKETRDELWDSKEELSNFVKNENNMRKYVSGECGSNLIFQHKALALRNALKEVIEAAYDCAREILRQKSPEILEKYSDYLSELQRYSELRKIDLFNTSHVFAADFHYDFLALESAQFKDIPDVFSKPDGVSVSFMHTDEQKKNIEGYLKVYGEDIVGISRILSKIYVGKIYRTLVQKDPI